MKNHYLVLHSAHLPRDSYMRSWLASETDAPGGTLSLAEVR